MEHRKKRGMLGSIGDLFDGPTGIGDALGLNLGDSANGAIELVAAGAAGAAAIKGIGYAESYYAKIPVVGPMIAKRSWATPAIRIALGAGAGIGLSMIEFPGSKALATGIGTTLVASGALDLAAVVQNKMAVLKPADLATNGLPISIREGGVTEQLHGLPLRTRDVSAAEQALGDMNYLTH